MLQGVVFDRDGVLINSEKLHVDSVKQAFEKVGICLTAEDESKFIVGRHPDDYFQDFSKKYDFSIEDVSKIQREYYFKLFDSVPLFDSAISLARQIHAFNIPLGLATSSGRKNTEEFLKRADLVNIFGAVVTFEDTEYRKPNPEPYLIATKKLNVDPKYCVAIEDSSLGVESAKSAGMKCIVIFNEYTKNQDFSKADLVVDSADKLTMAVLENLVK